MAEALVARRKYLGANTEGTKGTASAPASPLSGTIVYDAVMQPSDIFSNGQRLHNQGSTGTRPRIAGMKVGTLTFRTPLIPGDAFMSTLITGCGMGVTSSTATPASDQSTHETLTFVLWEAGRKKTMYGAAGNVTISAANAGERVFAEWNFQGLMAEDEFSDASLPTDPAVTAAPWLAKNMTLTLDSTDLPQTSGFSFNLGAQVEARQDNTAADGIIHYMVTDIVPTLSLQPEARLKATYDQWSKFFNGTAEALSLQLTQGAGTGASTFTISGPKVQRTSLGDSTRGQKLTDPIDLEMHIDSGNDQVSLAEA